MDGIRLGQKSEEFAGRMDILLSLFTSFGEIK